MVYCIGIVNKNANSGGDDISASMLLHAGPVALELLLGLLNKRVNGKFTDIEWKNALVTLLPKVSNACKAKDFRPITVLSTIYKVYEKLLFHWSMEFETDLFGKLPVFHHGFRSVVAKHTYAIRFATSIITTIST